MEILCGALLSPEDPDDLIFDHIACAAENVIEYRYMVDLRLTDNPPKNQGNRDTCAAFAAAGIKEIQEYNDCKFTGEMSPEFIYYHRANKPAHGMFGRNVFQILQKIGSVPEYLYPYGSIHEPTPELYEIAKNYRITNFAKITTVEGLKHALHGIGPCYLVLPLFASRPVFWKGEGTAHGGHAVVAVGFNEIGFILRNSWGAEWNNDGHIIFPYEDWHVHWECWVSIDEKTDPAEVQNLTAPRNIFSDKTTTRRKKWSLGKKITSDPFPETEKEKTEKPEKSAEKSEKSRKKRFSKRRSVPLAESGEIIVQLSEGTRKVSTDPISRKKRSSM